MKLKKEMESREQREAFELGWTEGYPERVGGGCARGASG
jgi:hypothetical protein